VIEQQTVQLTISLSAAPECVSPGPGKLH